MLGFRRDAQGAACLGRSTVRELLASAGTSTPAYLYDLDAIRTTAEELEAALGPEPHLVAYAMKANSAGSVLRTLRAAGLGVDVVSGGELALALSVGFSADQILMSGVAKSDAELDQAIAAGLFGIQVESVEEIARVAARARELGRRARVSIRVNPDVEIDSHAKISTGHKYAKFGVALADMTHAFASLDREPELLAAVGISVHIGSMMTKSEPYQRAARGVSELARVRRATSQTLEYVDFGGGIGIDYGGAPAEPLAVFARAARQVMRDFGIGDLKLVMEPGRSLVGSHGILAAKVIGTKQTPTGRFLLIDAGMNDLLRPAMYGAHHRIEPADWEPVPGDWRVVGPVCESSDDFGTHVIGERAPELVVIRDAGAYAFSMASEYNARPLPAELFVSEGQVASVSPSPGVSSWVERRLKA